MSLPKALLTLFASVAASSALAANNLHNGDLGGSSVIWQAKNQIFVSNGLLFINDSYYATPGGTIVTVGGTGNQKAVFDTVTVSQGKLKAYYVYAMAYGASGIAIVISSTAPKAEGSPSAALTFTPNGGTQQTNISTGEFLGSYISDNNSVMVPFARTGDEVLLEYNGTPVPQGTATFAHGDTFPETIAKNINVDSSNAITYPVPKSAQALLGFVEFDTTQALAKTLAILNPNALTVGAGCSYSGLLTASFGEPSIQFARVRLATATAGTASVSVLDCTAPAAGNSDSYKISYIGYVENVNLH